MDFDDTPQEAAFRQEARAWLEAHAARSAGGRGPAVAFRDEGDGLNAMIAAAKAWQRELYESGWAGITWQKEYGGRGGTAIEQSIFNEELAHFDVPPASIFTIGIGMVGPTIIRHGSDAQRQRYLRPLLRGDEVWCQLFSEPEAGSDLASLRTHAVRGDAGWVVNGQKVWTSGAHYREFGLLLARTDPEVPKHRGLTCFLVNMRSSGIEVRPLRQMTGGANFNEVFLTDLFIRDEDVLGPVNAGWAVAVTTLANERVALGGGGGVGMSDLIRAGRRHDRVADPLVRQELAAIYGEREILRYLGLRQRTALSRGEAPGPESSVAKLATGLHAGRVGDLALGLLGPAGAVVGDAAEDGGVWPLHRLGAPALRIAGGTDEVMRNIVGERVLGLPKEPRGAS